MTTPPGLPAASPTELGRGALPAALPDGCVWLADGSFGSWRSPAGAEHAATRRAAHGGHLRLSPPRRCSSPPHSGCPHSRAEPPPPTSQHHTNRPPLTTTNGPDGQEWCPSAPHNFDATWSWPGACWHSTRSSLPPCPPEHPTSSSPWPLHSRYAGGGFGRLVKAACQAGGLGLVRAHMCIKRPPGRAAATIAPRMVQTF